MHYQVSRNGQMYGPYTFEDLKRYLASGNVLPSDLAKSESMSEWVPVAQLIGGQVGATTVESFDAPGYAGQATYAAGNEPAFVAASAQAAVVAASTYPDPPNLSWGLYLLFTILTCNLFSKVFTLIQAVWLKKVQPNSNGLIFYIATYVLSLVNMFFGFGMWMSVVAHHGAGLHGLHSGTTRGPLGFLYIVLLIATRFVMSSSIEQHFNGPEPIGLRLNPVMVFFFGGLYFQYHFNKISTLKQMARYGAGRAV